jgi:hypothetical protein
VLKKCERFDECGSYIIQTTPNKKYCSNCAKDIDREKAKERMRNIRMFEATDSESIDVPKV